MKNGIEHLLESIGWALLQSTWQVFILGFILWIILKLQSNSTLRHNIAYIFLVLSLGSFIYAFNDHFFTSLEDPVLISTVVESDRLINEVFNKGIETVASANRSVTSTVGANLLPYQEIIALIWTLGFLVLLLKYSVAFWFSMRIRTVGLKPVSMYWENRLSVLKKQMAMTHNVVFKISDQIAGPLTIGFLKPIILFPAAVFTTLEPAEIESIILHELAHIKRWDYFLNGLQLFIKCVLFFHPCIYFMLKIIDQEREYSSDDQVINISIDRNTYAKALGKLHLNLFNHQNLFAMHARSKSDTYINRLNRILQLSSDKKKPNLLFNILPFFLLLATATIVTASVQKTVSTDQKATVENHLLQNDFFGPMDTIPAIKDKRKMELELRQKELEIAKQEKENLLKAEELELKDKAIALKHLSEIEAKSAAIHKAAMEIEFQELQKMKTQNQAEYNQLKIAKAQLEMAARQEELVHKELALLNRGKIQDMDQFKKDLFQVLIDQKLVKSNKSEVVIKMIDKKYYLNDQLVSRTISPLIQEVFSRHAVSINGGKKVIANSKIIDIGVGTNENKNYSGQWSFKG